MNQRPSIKRGWTLALALAAAIIAMSLVGCGGGSGGGNPGDGGPVYGAVSVLPALLGSTGGTVTITATITDPDGVAEVDATVSCEGRHTTIQMTNVGGSVYQGTYTAPPNPEVTNQTYIVYLTALDSQANQSNSPEYTFTVLSPY